MGISVVSRSGLALLVRPLEPSDSIPALTRLLHVAYRPLAERGMHYVASHQDDATTRRRCLRGEAFVADLGSEIIGTVTFYPPDRTDGSSWYDRPEVASFGQFAVHPEFQKHGIGSLLMDVIERRAQELGVTELALDTSEHADHLIRYYESRGYRFIEHVQWTETNYRSVVLSKTLQSSPVGHRGAA